MTRAVKMQHPQLPDDDPIEVAAGNVPNMQQQGWEIATGEPQPTKPEATNLDEE